MIQVSIRKLELVVEVAHLQCKVIQLFLAVQAVVQFALLEQTLLDRETRQVKHQVKAIMVAQEGTHKQSHLVRVVAEVLVLLAVTLQAVMAVLVAQERAILLVVRQ